MVKIIIASSVLRALKKYDKRFIEDFQEKLLLFQDRSQHERLKVHKLHGRMKDKFAFSINYKYRAVFAWGECDEAIIEDFGTHDLYD